MSILSKNNLLFFGNIFFIFMLFTCLECIAEDNEGKVDEQLMRKYADENAKKMKEKTITVKGKFVDEDGEIIENVNCKVEYVGSYLYLGDTRENKDFLIENGFFEFKCNGFQRMVISYFKKGYLPEFSKTYSLEEVAGKIEWGTPPYHSAEFLDEVIVMKEIGELAEVKKKDIAWSKIDVDNPQERIFDLETLTLVEFGKEKEPPKKYFYIEKGERNPNPSKLDTEYYYWLKYHSDDPYDGFILVEDITDFRLLREAPENGYEQKAINIRFIDKERFQYYFMKCGDKYAKIKFNMGYTNSKKDLFTVRFVMIMNEETDPALKRNLRSLER